MKSRLDKVLSAGGFGTRRDVKRLLRSRAFTVNGNPCVDPSTAVDPEVDVLALDGVPLEIKTAVYLMLNKIAGVVTSTDDPNHRTVMDLLAEPWSRMDLFPIGRLDADTEGLLIITNDGPLTHRLTSPKTGVDKTYLARLRDGMDADSFDECARRFREGVTLGDGYTALPAVLARPDGAPASEVLLTIQEGKYHQVKRMFKAVGNEVVYLKRVSMGPLTLDPALEPGEYRELSIDEIALLREGNGE